MLGKDGAASPRKRPRAPTITVDTSALDGDVPQDPIVASPASLRLPEQNTNSLAIPMTQRARADSQDSVSSVGSHTVVAESEHSGHSRHGSTSTGGFVWDDADALKPDPGHEEEFKAENNCFGFTRGQMSKLSGKSFGAFHAVRGLPGLERGLRTNLQTGLSVDEDKLSGAVSFEEATENVRPRDPMSPEESTGTLQARDSDKTLGGGSHGDNKFSDRQRIFGDNRLPERKSKTLWGLAWMALHDPVLILLSIAAVVSLALGLYQTFGPTDEEGARVEWVEGVAIIVAIAIVVLVGAGNDWAKERQFVKLSKKKDDREVKVIRSGRTIKISIHDVLVGDVMILEQGDILPVDGIYISGHNVACDESSATGESDIMKKTPADIVFKAMEQQKDLKKMDPFIISGAKVSEGVGTFLVTATGVNSTYGKIMISLRDEGQVTPLQLKLNVLAGKNE